MPPGALLQICVSCWSNFSQVTLVCLGGIRHLHQVWRKRVWSWVIADELPLQLGELGGGSWQRPMPQLHRFLETILDLQADDRCDLKNLICSPSLLVVMSSRS